MISPDALASAHHAISGLLHDGETAVAWTLTIDVAGADGQRYLAHRSGRGPDGVEPLPPWAVSGMAQATASHAESQLYDQAARAAADVFPPTFGDCPS